MDSQLGKIYSGMLYKVRLWVLAKLVMTVMFSNINLLHAHTLNTAVQAHSAIIIICN